MQHLNRPFTATGALQRAFDFTLKLHKPSNPAVNASPTKTVIPKKSITTTALQCQSKRYGGSFEHLNSPSRSKSAIDLSHFVIGSDGSRKNGPRRNEAIDAGRVYLRRANGTLGDSMLLSRVLAMRKRDENGKYVEFVQELAPANDERFYPVVHLKSWHEAKEEELARKRHKRATKVIEKRVEFGWSVDGSDLGHRLRRMQDFLKKGAKVEVAIGSRRLKGWRDKKEVDDEQAIALVNKVRKSAFEIEGTKETLSLQGKILDEVLFTFKGPKPGKEPMTEDSKAEAEPGRNIEDNATG